MREGEGGTEREGGRDGEGRREGEGFRDVEAFAKGADGAASVSGPSPPPAQPLPPLRPALSQPVWPSCAGSVSGARGACRGCGTRLLRLGSTTSAATITGGQLR